MRDEVASTGRQPNGATKALARNGGSCVSTAVRADLRTLSVMDVSGLDRRRPGQVGRAHGFFRWQTSCRRTECLRRAAWPARSCSPPDAKPRRRTRCADTVHASRTLTAAAAAVHPTEHPYRLEFSPTALPSPARRRPGYGPALVGHRTGQPRPSPPPLATGPDPLHRPRRPQRRRRPHRPDRHREHEAARVASRLVRVSGGA